MKRDILLILAVLITIAGVAQPQIASHRGFHQKDGAVRNSIEAIHDAHEAGFEWVEIDVTRSSDGVPLIIHGPYHPSRKFGVYVQTATKAKIQSYLLDNGEMVPTLDEMLQEIARLKTLGAIIDIKPHNTSAAQDDVVKKIAKAVSKYGLQDRVLYMTSIEQSARLLKKLNRRTDNILFTHGSYSPTWRKSLGYKYIGYNHTAWSKKPELLADCTRLGLKTVAWTPNNEADIRKVVKMGINIIISDNPMLVRKIINEHTKH